MDATCSFYVVWEFCSYIFAKYESNRIWLPAILRKSNWLRNDLFHTWELLLNFFLFPARSLSILILYNWMTEIWKLKIIANFIFCGGANVVHLPRRYEWEFTQLNSLIFLDAKHSHFVSSTWPCSQFSCISFASFRPLSLHIARRTTFLEHFHATIIMLTDPQMSIPVRCSL